MKETNLTNHKQIQQQLDEIKLKDKQLKDRDKTLQEKENQLRLLQGKLEDQRQVTEEIQQTNHSLQKQVEELQKELNQYSQPLQPLPQAQSGKGTIQERNLPKQLLQLARLQAHPKQVPLVRQKLQSLDYRVRASRERQIPHLTSSEIWQANYSHKQHVDQHSHQSDNPPQLPLSVSPQIHLETQDNLHQPVEVTLTLNWQKNTGKAPFEMVRGDAVVNGVVAYFVSTSGAVCSYNSTTRKWKKLLTCPYTGSSLVVINGHLTAIGGFEDLLIPQNKLHSLMSDRNKQWVEHYPPMPTRRHNSATVTTKEHLIVAGGEGDSTHCIGTVEVMDIQSLVWSMAASLPYPYTSVSAAISGDHFYMLGGFDSKGAKTKLVLTCSLTELLTPQVTTPPVQLSTPHSHHTVESQLKHGPSMPRQQNPHSHTHSNHTHAWGHTHKLS